MKLRTIPAVAVCKLIRGLLRLMGRGGTALPGRAAMLLDKTVLEQVSRNMHVILVTGTNGKTTTCRILENALKDDGKECMLNRSGANLVSGITAEFACNADWKGKARMEYAVIECDEGALRQAASLIHPEVIVVTNLFRDQLDRYGEVMTTRKKILDGILQSPQSTLCLNADCPLTASLSAEVSNQVLFYGINVPAGHQEERELSDAKYCIHCGAPLQYDYYTYAHLGAYHCPSCGWKRPEPQTAVDEILELQPDESKVKLTVGDQSRTVSVHLPAVYNLYNALAALCAGTAIQLELNGFLEAVSETEAPFGRMEHFLLNDRDIRMILVKNPAGCDQALEYVSGCESDYGIVFLLNDRTADGHDISWIWDAQPEKIVRDPHRKTIWVGGTRAEDMQLRLKYAGAAEEEIIMEKDPAKLIQQLKQGPPRLFILPNYTSMLDFRQVLIRETGGTDFWEG